MGTMERRVHRRDRLRRAILAAARDLVATEGYRKDAHLLALVEPSWGRLPDTSTGCRREPTR
jgi:hypothetical protein